MGSFNIERCVLVFSYLVIWLASWLNSFTWHTPEENRPALVNGRPLYHSRTALHLVPLIYPAIFRPRPADQAGRSKFFHKETDMVKNTVSAPVFAVKYAGNL